MGPRKRELNRESLYDVKDVNYSNAEKKEYVYVSLVKHRCSAPNCSVNKSGATKWKPKNARSTIKFIKAPKCLLSHKPLVDKAVSVMYNLADATTSMPDCCKLSESDEDLLRLTDDENYMNDLPIFFGDQSKAVYRNDKVAKQQLQFNGFDYGFPNILKCFAPQVANAATTQYENFKYYRPKFAILKNVQTATDESDANCIDTSCRFVCNYKENNEPRDASGPYLTVNNDILSPEMLRQILTDKNIDVQLKLLVKLIPKHAT